MATPCTECNDSGFRVVERADGVRLAQLCRCRTEARTQRLLEAAQIPLRYQHCTLEDYETLGNPDLERAAIQARNFVKAFPLETDGTGLLLTGSVGCGKTHLAISLLHTLIVERGVRGMFCDYRELLKRIQGSYDPSSPATERSILRPVFEAEVLVLDELGAARRTDWVWDTVEHILNTRYNDRRTTILTTNYPNERPLGDTPATALGGARAAMIGETLGDRVGERMRSRLHEMCLIFDIQGADLRKGLRAAGFGGKHAPPLPVRSSAAAIPEPEPPGGNWDLWIDALKSRP